MPQRLLRPILTLLGAAVVAGAIAARFPAYAAQICFLNGVLGVAVLMFVPASGPVLGVGPLLESIRDARRGRAIKAPEGTTPELTAAFDDLSALSEERAEAEKTRKDVEARVTRAEREAEQKLSQATREAEQELSKVRREADSEISRLRREIEQEGTRVRREVEQDAARARRDLEDEISKLRRALDAAREESREAEKRGASKLDLREPVARLADVVKDLETSQPAGAQVASDLGGSVRGVNQALVEVYQSIETLATSAEESSSSILEMTTTNEEVAQNVAELAASVRETATSIEEMAYSIREVARNIDALSLTAEETSSSMNEMDVSIDQVQSNANETARLSEEVALDAERGAEAILKTIGEINRIRESSMEAVSVISNLGSRIEAIGQILAVIDDVAEQTNLLALNAAIIAAQAGEHGKGFAVVADEIKDLAERAGGSTKEIAELIKTIQAESRNAISAVERGAQNVSRGVEVSNEAERALKKILESSQKSTAMVRAIARATVEQAKGSKQVTDAIGRIAETVQQIAAATAQQARGSDQIMKSAEKMRMITQHVERSSQEQARGGRQITASIEQISSMVNALNASQRTQRKSGEQLLEVARKVEDLARATGDTLKSLRGAYGRLERALAVSAQVGKATAASRDDDLADIED
ncbi:MAG: methyl-accepting chemotaxis protein [Polyangiaceae bacterium]